MDWQDGTGEGVQVQCGADRSASLTYESVSGDRWAQGIETAGSRSTGENQRRFNDTSMRKVRLPTRRVPYKALQRRRLYLQSCLEELERAESVGEDPILRSNVFTQVRDHLQQLWELLEGDSQSEAFEEIVNVLQIAFCDESLDVLGPRQWTALKSVFVKLCEDPDIDDQVANELTRELIRGGVDVFREIG
jgi:hypothetical protein